MLPRHLSYFLIVFDMFGSNSGLTRLTKNQNTARIIYFVHILLVILSINNNYHLYRSFYVKFKIATSFHLNTYVGMVISEYLQYSTAFYTYLMVVGDMILHNKLHRRFWKLYQTIEKRFHNQSNIEFKVFLFKFIEFFLVTIIAMVWILKLGSSYLKLGLVFICLIKACEIRAFYYIFCLEIVYYQFQLIEKEILNIKNVFNITDIKKCHPMLFADNSALRSFLSHRLKWIRNYFHCIYVMADHLNIMFGWSNVAVILHCFYLPLADFTWCYVVFSNLNLEAQIGKYIYFDSSFWILLHILIGNFIK